MEGAGGLNRRERRVLIRPASLDDLDALDNLENAVFTTDRLSRRSLRYYVTASSAVFLAVELSGQLAGDAILGLRRGSAVARLYSIAIRPDLAGQGLGKRLLVACEAAAADRGRTTLRLEVRADNTAAVRTLRESGLPAVRGIPRLLRRRCDGLALREDDRWAIEPLLRTASHGSSLFMLRSRPSAATRSMEPDVSPGPILGEAR